LARWLNAQEVIARVGMDQRPRGRLAGLDRHPEGACDQRRGRGGLNRPANHPTRAGIQHHRAVDLAFTGGVFGDVGHPQLVWAGAGELPLDQVSGGRFGSQATAKLGATGDALQAGATHQQLHGVVTDGDATALAANRRKGRLLLQQLGGTAWDRQLSL
jgi:hypothetical protein